MLAYTITLNIWQMWILTNVDYIFSSKFLFRYILFREFAIRKSNDA
jgi:hypothetical protein